MAKITKIHTKELFTRKQPTHLQYFIATHCPPLGCLILFLQQYAVVTDVVVGSWTQWQWFGIKTSEMLCCAGWSNSQ